MEPIKYIIIILVAALAFGALGASLLQYSFTVMGATCMVLAGLLAGTVLGYIFALMDGEDEL